MERIEERMAQDMVLAGLSGKTQKSYRWVLRAFEKGVGGRVREATETDVRGYLVALVQRGSAASTVRVHTAGLRFLFEVTLQRQMAVLGQVKAARKAKLPVVLSRDEVRRLVGQVRHDAVRTILLVTYGCGLRLSEGTGLRLQDIDGQRQLLWVRDSKGGKDRRVPLPEPTLQALRAYYRRARPAGPYLFGSVKTPGQHLHNSVVQRTFRKAWAELGLAKQPTIHSLRHSWATHALEDGLSLVALQHYLGHNTIRTTVRYVQLTQVNIGRTRSILNGLTAALVPDASAGRSRRPVRTVVPAAVRGEDAAQPQAGA